MKHLLSFILVAFFLNPFLKGQTPDKMSYQAIIRDQNNNLISNNNVGIQISILQGSADGKAVYIETRTIKTNDNGLISIEIGGKEGFDAINWSKGPYFLKTETDPTGGSNYTITGTSEILSVPYAFHAHTADSILTMDKFEAKYDLMRKALINNGLLIKDVDNNVYSTVTIGTQVWMAENLRTSRYNDGTPIPQIEDNSQWTNDTLGAYCWYNNDSVEYENPYGKLYNWYAVNTDKLCPVGWHVPSDQEWKILIDYLGGTSIAGGKLKDTGTKFWISPNLGATNETGFTALPGGGCDYSGYSWNNSSYGYWWSQTEYDTTTEAWYFSLDYNYPDILKGHYLKNFGFSVRCLKN
ncbi:MAG TPA: fibrobacter succinogenes major paralogous domain-containing protein [Bacteroidales bacterium]|nr:fibrobacter succinogenes major paralogous domain-containing protein [Bacteroidales bacterium]